MSKIKRLIKKGEGKTIEFKRTLPDGNNMAKTVIAFSNMAGGKIIIGVEDKTAKVIGINDDEAMDFPDKISNIIHERCHPFILPEIYLVHINDAKVLVVEVFPGALKPYYLKNKGKREEIEFIEQWGNGIRKMLRLLKQDGLPDPQFRESGLFFKIIIYKKKTQETTTETTTKTSGESEKIIPKTLSEEDIDTNGEIAEEKGTTTETTIVTTTETTIKIHGELLKLIKAKPSIRLIELAERMHLTKDGAWYHLKKLKEAGILNRVGPTKGGYWKINEDRIPKSTT